MSLSQICAVKLLSHESGSRKRQPQESVFHVLLQRTPQEMGKWFTRPQIWVAQIKITRLIYRDLRLSPTFGRLGLEPSVLDPL